MATSKRWRSGSRVALLVLALGLVLTSAHAGPGVAVRDVGPPPRLHVLAIGIDQYPHLNALEQLKLAVEDVRTLVEQVNTRSSALYASVTMTVLLNEAATGSSIEQAFESLVRLARPQDTVLVHFSGNAGLVPDAEVGAEIALWAHDTTHESRRTGLGAGIVTMPRVGAWLTRIEANRQLFLLDTAGSTESLRRLQEVLIDRDEGLTGIVPRTRLVVGLDGPSWEAPAVVGNGPITAAFLRALAGEADFGTSPDGWLTAFELEAALPSIYRQMVAEILEADPNLEGVRWWQVRPEAQRLRVLVVGPDVRLLTSSKPPRSAPPDAGETRGPLRLPEDHGGEAGTRPGAPRRDHALLLATDEYDDAGWRRLNNPILDARALRKTLEQDYGFACTMLENPTYDRMIEAIAELQRRAFGPDDQLLIFVAGHGTYNDVLKQGYVIARDSTASARPERALGNTELRSAVEAIEGCRHILVVLDTCFGGTFDGRIASGGHRGRDVYERSERSAFIREILQHRTRRYLTSGGKRYVSDGRPGRHSPFMHHLLERLRGDEVRATGLVTSTDLESHLQGLRPEPRAGWFGSNEPGAKFLFVRRP